MDPTRITDAIVIPKDYIAFNSIAFVCGAISKDETRLVLCHMEVARNGLVTSYAATDGKRLHVAELDPGLFDDDIDVLDPGLYLVVAKSSKFIVLQKTEAQLSFPNWRMILGDYELGDNLAEVCDLEDSGKIGEVMIRTGRLLDTAFLAAAMGYGTSRKATEHVGINFEAKDDNGPVFIAHDHGTAVVMPMTRKEPDPELKDDVASHETTPFKALADAMTPGDSMSVSVDGEKVAEFTKEPEEAAATAEEEPALI